MNKRVLMTTVILAACGGGGDDGQASEASASLSVTAATMSSDGSAGDETGACEDGSPGCACVNGMCLDPLVCLDGICSWPPPPTTGPDDTSGGESSDGGSDTGPVACSTNDDCGWYEVCGVEGTCIDATEAAYEVFVPNWSPSTCDGGPLDGDADLYWELVLDGVVIGRSGWVQGGCPGNWGDVVCVQEGLFAENFYLKALDEDDGTNPDLMDTLWWDEDMNSAPDPIDPYYLNQGVIDTATGSGGHVRVEFTVVGSCG